MGKASQTKSQTDTDILIRIFHKTTAITNDLRDRYLLLGNC
jgi:hypothetical protein